jgi:Mrp family chromosome partitioning ATPase
MMTRTDKQKHGIVYTFYSYKGGVGRSMAVANVGALLAAWGKRVLIVDWDLEAPGIEKFFEKWLTKTRRDTPGLLDLIVAFDTGEPIAWRDCLLRANLSPSAELTILSAGLDDESYAPRLQQVNWERLFAEKKFGNYLERLRNEWLLEYDFILIDSRTGVTDIGGICTIHLPDIVVTLFTSSEQSLAGVRNVMTRARSAHAALPVDRKRLLIIPIPARDESLTEYKLAQEWRGRFARELDEFFRDWAPRDEKTEDILDRLKIPYFAYWSFGERLPVMEEDAENPKTLAFSYQLIARLLLGKLNWAEVKHGTAATQAAAEQKVKAEQLALEAAQARIDVQREFAEREMVRLEQQKERFLETRWRSIMSSYEWQQVVQGNVVRWTGVILGIILFMAAIAGWWVFLARQITTVLGNSIALGLVALGFVALLAAVPLLLHFRRKQSRARATVANLRRERSLFEGFAGPYSGMNGEPALRRFIERTEMIVEDEERRAANMPAGSFDAAKPSSSSPSDVVFGPGATHGSGQQTTPPVSESPEGPSFSPTSAAAAEEGPYDIFISYRSNPLTTAWLNEFIPFFSGFLASLLPAPPRIFYDTATVSAGEELLQQTMAALESARALLVILSPAYFQSSTCLGELERFLARGREAFVIPLLLQKTELPESVRNLRYFDFSDLFFVGIGFTQSALYIDFQKRVRQLAQEVADQLAKIPSTIEARAVA